MSVIFLAKVLVWGTFALLAGSMAVAAATVWRAAIRKRSGADAVFAVSTTSMAVLMGAFAVYALHLLFGIS